MVVITLTPTQIAEEAMIALKEAQAALADAQVAVSRAMIDVGIFETNFRSGTYKEEAVPQSFTFNDTPTNTKDLDRIGAQMQEYMHEVKRKEQEKKEWAEKLKCKCGEPHGRKMNPDYNKASDFVA